MPTVSVLKSEFYRKLGTTLSTEELETLCFEFGIEYDGTELSETGAELLKIEVPANRYDLLCIEGLVSALLTYKWNLKSQKYRLEPSTPEPYAKIAVGKECKSLRPYIFAAVLRDIKLNNESYKSLIDLQEKLHQNICRKRTIAAIGTHDLDSIKPPFTYTLERPEDIIFSPLTDGTKEYNAQELLKIYESHPQLKAYVKILENAELYPVVRDSNGDVCSLPPIINSFKSRITLETRNIFVEVTATDKTKGRIVLGQIVSVFSQYCSNKFAIEPILIQCDEDIITPNIIPRVLRASTTYLSTLTGIKDLTPEFACSLLEKMMISATVIDGNTIEAHIPITRSDVQHPCDLGEDIAIAYGYKNIGRKTFNMGSLLEKTILVKNIRTLFTSCSYKETLMPILDSFKSGYESMNWKIPPENDIHSPVVIKNSQVAEQEILRTTLIPGLLKTVFTKKAALLPIRIFEVCTSFHEKSLRSVTSYGEKRIPSVEL